MRRSMPRPAGPVKPRTSRALSLLCAALVGCALTSAPAQAAAPPEAPTTQAATAIGASGATLHGTLNPGSSSEKVSYYFAYSTGTTCTEGEIAPEEFPLPEVEGNHKQVSVPLAGLEGDTDYVVCLVARSLEEEPQTSVGTQISFTTSAVAPEILSVSAADVTPSTASLQAEVNPENQSTACRFEYGKTTAYGTIAPCEPPVLAGGSAQAAGLSLTGLEPASTYHYRLVVANATGESHSADGQLTTVAVPSVTTGAASEIGRISALLSGAIDPQRAATRYHFLYITQAGYEAALAHSASDPYAEGASTATHEMPSADESQAIEALLADGLLPETTYHYALVAGNSAGAVIGADRTFTTGSATPPIVTTGSVSAVTLSTATLSGVVDTRGLATSYAFEVSTSPDQAGAPTGAGSIDIGVGEASVSLTLQGLLPGTVYYYRALATSLDGTDYGSVQSFTTPLAASALAAPAAAPLIATPTITFPAEAAQPQVKAPVVKKQLTRARRLEAALSACKKQPPHARARCRQKARARYT